MKKKWINNNQKSIIIKLKRKINNWNNNKLLKR